MKKTIAISTTLLFVLLCVNSVFADTVKNNYGTNNAGLWKYADLGGSPTAAYATQDSEGVWSFNGSYYGGGAGVAYKDTQSLVANPAWEQRNDWIGPAASASADGSTSAGYTAYRVSGFQTFNDILEMTYTADNGVANIFVVNAAGGVVDLLASAFAEVSYENAGSYTGISYDSNPYDGDGLHKGHAEMDVRWADLMKDLGWDAEGKFDIYFITQNTNPGSGPSATGFACNFDGIVPTENTTPEPATLLILGLGVAGAGLARRRQLRK